MNDILDSDWFKAVCFVLGIIALCVFFTWLCVRGEEIKSSTVTLKLDSVTNAQKVAQVGSRDVYEIEVRGHRYLIIGAGYNGGVAICAEVGE